ncbi:hypothetical protein G6F61_001975 [Rhizopus arrhizus]|nr:hypothetical protein G6F42_024102 [Rhizopus arrhizus]KAG1382768.1 hypothetical protein G6F61_001975 [Rhizopus arrhizus]
MHDISENDTANPYLTAAKVFKLFKRLQIERDENLHGSDLPLEISEYLDGMPMYELKVQTFQKTDCPI